MDDDNFFAMPPSEAPPVVDDSGYAMFGDDMAPMGGSDMGFAGGAPTSEPTEDDFGDMGFASAAPAEELDNFAVVDDAPIILGGPPPVEDDVVIVDEPIMETSEPLPIVSLEPSHMQKWNDAFQTTLTERKAEEDSKQAEMEATAKAFLEKFQADKEAKRESKMAKNREDEQAKLEAIEADLENDNSWQRVCKMVELSHDGAHEGEDVKKMRDVLILLKNDVPRASAVGA